MSQQPKTLKVKIKVNQDYNALITYYAGRPGCHEAYCKRYIHVDPVPSETVVIDGNYTSHLQAFIQSTFLSPEEYSRDCWFQFISQEDQQKHYDKMKEDEAKNGWDKLWDGCVKYKWFLAAIVWIIVFCAAGGTLLSRSYNSENDNFPVGFSLLLLGVFAAAIFCVCFPLHYGDDGPSLVRTEGSGNYRFELAENV